MPKKPGGSLLETLADVLPENQITAMLLPPNGGVMDWWSEVHAEGSIMDHLNAVSPKNDKGATLVKMDKKSTEDRSIKVCGTQVLNQYWMVVF